MAAPDLDDVDLPLTQVFAIWPATAAVFQSHRMHCLGCPIAPFHTVADACCEYRLDVTAFRAELHRAVSARVFPNSS